MIENNNILLISEDENATELILNKLVLLRDNDKITKCNCKETKKALQNSLYCVVLLYADIKEQESIFKTIKTIKETKPDSEIILIPNDINTELILKAYDAGIYDYVPIDAESFDFVIKTINCYKLRTLKNIEQRNEKFLYQQGVIDEKTNLYKCNYLKDIFIDIANRNRFELLPESDCLRSHRAARNPRRRRPFEQVPRSRREKRHAVHAGRKPLYGDARHGFIGL